ncbi:MAG: hypothetical protein Q7J76_08135 [Candidatus Brocadiaceae bacterium]|uniref:hypothetical protein n=1 Tax=Candidatus Wunengus sp. YC61 TaxID=3367698 RepID=UPI00271B790B|nr:hypothetical protein [Candidatus Brocadiaceae bacterium]
MKKYFVGVFVFMFVAALSSAHQVFAQETYDFNGSIQVKVGKKKIKEEVGGTVDVFISEEENDEDFVKKGNSKSSHDDYDDEGTFESATFSFDFGADDTECGDTLDEESIEVDAEPQEDGGGGSKRNVRIELDQNAMTDLIGRILEKYGATVQEALDLDDCFSTTGGGGEQNVNFWVNYVSGTAYIKSSYIKISFSGNAEIQISDQDHQNQKRYTQRISGKLTIQYPDPDH